MAHPALVRLAVDFLSAGLRRLSEEAERDFAAEASLSRLASLLGREPLPILDLPVSLFQLQLALAELRLGYPAQQAAMRLHVDLLRRNPNAQDARRLLRLLEQPLVPKGLLVEGLHRALVEAEEAGPGAFFSFPIPLALPSVGPSTASLSGSLSSKAASWSLGRGTKSLPRRRKSGSTGDKTSRINRTRDASAPPSRQLSKEGGARSVQPRQRKKDGPGFLSSISSFFKSGEQSEPRKPTVPRATSRFFLRTPSPSKAAKDHMRASAFPGLEENRSSAVRW